VVGHVPVVGADPVGGQSRLLLDQLQDLTEGHDPAAELQDLLPEPEDPLLEILGCVLGEHMLLEDL
jgi:hypothetical protein